MTILNDGFFIRVICIVLLMHAISILLLFIVMLKVMRDARQLLVYTKEWFHLDKGVREDVACKTERTERAATRIENAVAEMPEKTAAKIAEVVKTTDSQDGIMLIPKPPTGN